MKTKRTTGLVLGKFYPPHSGHKYLVDFALKYVDDLTLVVGTLQAEEIPGALRYRWMRESFPAARVCHLEDENPQQPHEHPQFWKIWEDSLRKFVPNGVEYVFASEQYGWKLAEVLGATFVPVNIERSHVPVSGTAIRSDPLRHWEYLLPCVRPHYLKRVCIFGPESTGKSTLTKRLAEHFKTKHVSEYARVVLEANQGKCTAKDLETIARGQIASEEALALQAQRVLFCDTDPLTTTIWGDELFGECPEWIRQAAEARHYDLYLLTDVDVPWMADQIRYLPEKRVEFFERCKHALSTRGRPYTVISGDWEERFRSACSAVERLLLAPADRNDPARRLHVERTAIPAAEESNLHESGPAHIFDDRRT